MNFQGEFHNTIDAKGRASIPAKFREVLAETQGDERVVVTKNLEGGLTAYPLSHWSQILENVQGLPNGPQKAAAIRLMVAPAAECAFDKQGRIQIPQALRSDAGLKKEIVVVGLFEKIEIYSQLQYAAVTSKSEELLQSDSQAVADMGF
ncbi:MAG: division/cell wall cluster transcriptional repressor MraZ [Desulfuromonas sp.]|uniref:division/cell wall cluster transcriptional repressor MraZ n=1 Tax=Desulfuromonas sp. TaxID=892 RepID=UPI000CC0D0B1|nr:division/cell wall cluster transcriptional repressor MraZ [Desulfuromonas sp.]PLX81646.1 MAG: division/cell wall cluster transcriptional repressor MraZ [Desulfuromonas sp.]